jgi:crossover junction endodeoxyribonuclease RusA
VRVDLPWPPTALRPNAASPGAWRRKSEAARQYKADCILTCRAAGLGRVSADRLHLSLRFCAPTNAAYDLDNALARVKHGIDAIAHVTGVDDQHYGFTITKGPKAPGNGRVEVTITEAGEG